MTGRFLLAGVPHLLFRMTSVCHVKSLATRHSLGSWKQAGCLSEPVIRFTEPEVDVTQLATFRSAVLGLALMAFVVSALVSIGGHNQVSADPKPPVEFGCFVFEIDSEDCPNGALIVHDRCEVWSQAIPESPTSKLQTYEDYLDLDAIHASGPDFDDDGLGELVTGINAPGDIKLVVTPGGNLNIQCKIDVSQYVLDDAPKKALVTEFLCGPPGDIDRRGTSRLTSNGSLKINCHIADFGG